MKPGYKIPYYTQINAKWAFCGSHYCGNGLNELMDISYSLRGRVNVVKGEALLFKSKLQLQHDGIKL